MLGLGVCGPLRRLRGVIDKACEALYIKVKSRYSNKPAPPTRSTKIKKGYDICRNPLILNGRGERIRTSDILLPKQARYQAALRPAKHKTTNYHRL